MLKDLSPNKKKGHSTHHAPIILLQAVLAGRLRGRAQRFLATAAVVVVASMVVMPVMAVSYDAIRKQRILAAGGRILR